MARARPLSLAVRYPLHGALVNLALLVALALFGVGVFAPLVQVNRFFIFHDEISLAQSLIQLARDGHHFIFAVLSVFSIAFPLLKLGIAFRLCNARLKHTGASGRQLQWLGAFGKWSMLDVFVVAVLLMAVRLEVVAEIEVRVGLYAFAASVVLSMLITARLATLLKHPQ